jgi:hypothetical protein
MQILVIFAPGLDKLDTHLIKAIANSNCLGKECALSSRFQGYEEMLINPLFHLFHPLSDQTIYYGDKKDSSAC